MVRFIVFVGFVAAICSCSHIHYGEPTVSQPETSRVGAKQPFSVKRDLTYTDDSWPSRQVGDLYLPAETPGPESRPAVLLIHGGGWKEPERRRDMQGIAEALASRGYVVFNVTYRLTPEWQFPAPVNDLREAIRWLRRHAKQYQIDSNRIATFGYSAGGHLAALIGLMPGPSETRVQAIVAGGAPSDLTFYRGGTLVPQFIGGGYTEKPEVFLKASPVSYVDSGDPPVFLYHAANDKLVPPEHPLHLYAALEKAGVPRELFWLKGRNHITGFTFGGESEKTAFAFLDRIFEIKR